MIWIDLDGVGLLPGEHHLGSGRINKMPLGFCLDDSCCYKLVCNPGMGLEGGPVPAVGEKGLLGAGSVPNI